MATHEILKYHIPKFWGDEFKELLYINETFNDVDSLERWTVTHVTTLHCVGWPKNMTLVMTCLTQ